MAPLKLNWKKTKKGELYPQSTQNHLNHILFAAKTASDILNQIKDVFRDPLNSLWHAVAPLLTLSILWLLLLLLGPCVLHSMQKLIQQALRDLHHLKLQMAPPLVNNKI